MFLGMLFQDELDVSEQYRHVEADVMPPTQPETERRLER